MYDMITDSCNNFDGDLNKPLLGEKSHPND